MLEKLKQVYLAKRTARYKNRKKPVLTVRSVPQGSKSERYWNDFIAEHNIDLVAYKAAYIKYKTNCPNRHLELLFNIPYNQVRNLNKHLGLKGGGSGHKHGKITI